MLPANNQKWLHSLSDPSLKNSVSKVLSQKPEPGKGTNDSNCVHWLTQVNECRSVIASRCHSSFHQFVTKRVRNIRGPPGLSATHALFIHTAHTACSPLRVVQLNRNRLAPPAWFVFARTRLTFTPRLFSHAHACSVSYKQLFLRESCPFPPAFCDMSLSWSELCTAAQARPLDDLLRDVYAVGAVLVRSTLCPLPPPPISHRSPHSDHMSSRRRRCVGHRSLPLAAMERRGKAKWLEAVRLVLRAFLPRQRCRRDGLCR